MPSPAGLAYTFLTPSLPAHPGARETARKRVMRTQFHQKPLMKPGGIIQQACSGAPSRVCEHHHHRGSSRRTPNRLHRFLFFYYTTLSTQLSGTTRGTQLRSPLSLQRSISTPELILLCEIATLSKAESTTRGVSSAQPKLSGLSTRTQLISAAALEGPSCNTTSLRLTWKPLSLCQHLTMRRHQRV